MELKKTYNWIGDLDFVKANPQHFAIAGVIDDEGDTVMQLHGSIGFRQISIWGNNQNSLIDAFGTNTDDWVGKKVAISQEIDPKTNKKLKVISPVR